MRTGQLDARVASSRERRVELRRLEREQQVANDVLLGQPSDQLGLLERNGELAGDQREQLLGVFFERLAARGDEHAELLAPSGNGHGEQAPALTLQPELFAADRRLGGGRGASAEQLAQQGIGMLRGARRGLAGWAAREELEPSSGRVELVDSRSLAAEQRTHAVARGAQHLLAAGERGDAARDRGELGQRLHSPARALIELRVLDRACEQRRGLLEHLQRRIVELARRDRVEHDHADRGTFARADGHGRHRLEALLFELGHVVGTRIGECVLTNECRRVALRDPAGQALVDVELELADEVRIDVRCGAQSQSLAAPQVDEAGVAARCACQ